MNRKTVWICIVVLTIAVGVHGSEQEIASLVESSGNVCAAGYLELPYRQAVVGAELPGAYTVVLFLHGAGERGSDNEQHLVFGYEPMVSFCVQNKVKAVLLFPQCPKFSQWSTIRIPEKDPPLTAAPAAPLASAMVLLQQKTAEFNAKDIFAVGISMGGYGVWDLLARYPGHFTAAVAVCGGGDPNYASCLVETPLFVAHGTSDILVPVERSRSMVKAIWLAGGTKVIYQEFPLTGHDVWNNVFAEELVWEWLFKKKGVGPRVPKRYVPLPLPRVLPWQRRLFGSFMAF